jgi:hypothetical protein
MKNRVINEVQNKDQNSLTIKTETNFSDIQSVRTTFYGSVVIRNIYSMELSLIDSVILKFLWR